MINCRIVFFLTLVLIELSSCGQTSEPIEKGGYSIDSTIRKKIDKIVKSPDGQTRSSMEYKLYRDGSLVENTYTDNETHDPCYTMIFLDGETINMFAFAGETGDFGYRISLFKDTCKVGYFVKSKAPRYKLNRNDSLEDGINVPCKAYKLVLSEKPVFDKGTALEGIIELTSNDYYEVVSGQENKYKIQLRSYFRTNPIMELYLPKNRD